MNDGLSPDTNSILRAGAKDGKVWDWASEDGQRLTLSQEMPQDPLAHY